MCVSSKNYIGLKIILLRNWNWNLVTLSTWEKFTFITFNENFWISQHNTNKTKLIRMMVAKDNAILPKVLFERKDDLQPLKLENIIYQYSFFKFWFISRSMLQHQCWFASQLVGNKTLKITDAFKPREVQFAVQGQAV